MAWRCDEENSAALIVQSGTLAANAQARAKAANSIRYMSKGAPIGKEIQGRFQSMYVDEAAPRILDLLRLAMDIFGAEIAG